MNLPKESVYVVRFTHGGHINSASRSANYLCNKSNGYKCYCQLYIMCILNQITPFTNRNDYQGRQASFVAYFCYYVHSLFCSSYFNLFCLSRDGLSVKANPLTENI